MHTYNAEDADAHTEFREMCVDLRRDLLDKAGEHRLLHSNPRHSMRIEIWEQIFAEHDEHPKRGLGVEVKSDQ